MPNPNLDTQIAYQKTKNSIANGIGGAVMKKKSSQQVERYYKSEKPSTASVSASVDTPVYATVKAPSRAGSPTLPTATGVPIILPSYALDTIRFSSDTITESIKKAVSGGTLTTDPNPPTLGTQPFSSYSPSLKLSSVAILGPISSTGLGGGAVGGTSVIIDTTAERVWSEGSSNTSAYERSSSLIDSVWEHQKGKKAYMEVVKAKSGGSGGTENEISVEFILMGYNMSESEDVQFFKGFNMTLINSFGSSVPVINMTLALPHNRLKPWYGNFHKLYGDKIKATTMIRKGYECYMYLGNDSFNILPISLSSQPDPSSKYMGMVNMQAVILNYDIFADVQKVITSIDAKKAGNMKLKKSVPAAVTVAGKKPGSSGLFGNLLSGLSRFLG